MWHDRKCSAALVIVIALLASAPAFAQAPDANEEAAAQAERMRAQVVGSMMLTGSLSVAADGTIATYTIDRADHVPPQVLQHVGRHVPHWRVMKAADLAGEKRFSARVMATPQADGTYALSLVGASITQPRNAADGISVERRPRRPEYPRAYRMAGVGGTVYMLLKIGRDGAVQDLVAEQVDLDFVGAADEVAQARADFAAQTAAALRQWTFRMPVSGPLVAAPYLVLRIPVNYTVKPSLVYGEWEYYVPGPQRSAAWAEQDDVAIGTGEAGVPYLVGVEPRLETPLEPRRN